MLSPEQKIFSVGPAGAWGSAFAKIAAEQGHEVRLYIRDVEDLRQFRRTRRTKRLPGETMPANVIATSDKAEFIEGTDLFVVATPSSFLRPYHIGFQGLKNPRTPTLILSKGLEEGTNLTMSQVWLEEDPTSIDHIAVLSGPNVAGEMAHVNEIAQLAYAGTVVAAYNPEIATLIQSWLNSKRLRIYTSEDVLGVEFGGSLKNVMALGAGMGDELGAPPISKAFYFTRALEEMVRFGTALGAHEATFRGLAVVGDLYLSCIPDATRNYRAGVKIAKGQSRDEILASSELAEGLYTIGSAAQLARENNIDAPIIFALYDVLFNGLNIYKAIDQWMDRPPTKEQQGDRGLHFRLGMLWRRALHNIGNPLHSRSR